MLEEIKRDEFSIEALILLDILACECDLDFEAARLKIIDVAYELK